MAHEKYDDDVLVLTSNSWHGKHDLIVNENIAVPDGFAASRMGEIKWEAKPLYIEVEPSKLVPFGKKKGLVREKHFRAPEFHIVTNRMVKDYQVINNDFLIQLAEDLAKRTGWTFEGCGTLRHNELSFVQLRLGDVNISGKRHERHIARFLYSDDKGSSSSGNGGLCYTRVECDNTHRAAIREEGMFKIPHVDDPQAMWRFVNAKAIAAVDAFHEQNAM